MEASSSAFSVVLPPHCSLILSLQEFTKLSQFSNQTFFLLAIFSPGKSKETKLRESELILMEANKEQNGPWLSVPQFGDWDQKGQVPDYSLDFSKIRENRKQNKREVSRASLGNEEELASSTTQTKNASPIQSDQLQSNQIHKAPPERKNIFSCFNCCVRA